MLTFRTKRFIELSVLLFFAVFHVIPYLHFSRAKNAQVIKPPPIFITLEQPKPKPDPKKIEPTKKVEAPKPKPVTPPKPPKPPKELKKTPPAKTKPVEKKPQRVVEKPKLQQESPIKVHAEEVVEKEVVEKPQQLSEPEVKKPEPKEEEKAVETPPAPEPEPVHEPVVTKAGYGGSCKSALNRYPTEAKEQGIEGTVKIKVQVLADGSVGNVSIIKSSGSDILDNSVLEHVHDCDFEPATKDDAPITSSVVIPVKFKLDN